MTYREERERAAGLLSGSGIEQAETEARQLMEYVCGTDLGFFLLHAGDEMSAEEAEAYSALVRQRSARIPLQHITGEQEFMGLRFRVNGKVLIPRPETELLAEAAVRAVEDIARSAGQGPVRVLDLCTGSGCIAAAVKAFCPDAEVSGSDISDEALEVAAENAALNGVDVNWICADLFGADIGIFDLIVCNPPYIPTKMIDTLMPEVRDHDPRMALDGGEDGLDFYRRILDECGAHISRGGRILFETGYDQGGAVAALLKEHGYDRVKVSRDLAGFDRIAEGIRR